MNEEIRAKIYMELWQLHCFYHGLPLTKEHLKNHIINNIDELVKEKYQKEMIANNLVPDYLTHVFPVLKLMFPIKNEEEIENEK